MTKFSAPSSDEKPPPTNLDVADPDCRAAVRISSGAPAVEVILNGSAGSGTNDDVAGLFKKAGIAANISIAKNGGELNSLAKLAAKSPSSVVVAGGGDGTLNTVASEIVDKGKIFGVLPLGTLNHFAKDLGIPLDLPGAIRTVKEGHVTAIDIGDVNGHIFLNNSSLGLYPDMVRRRDKAQQMLNRGKWSAFVKATLDVMRRCKFVRVEVRGEEVKMRRDTPFVFIGNNQYRLDGFGIGGRETMNRGDLCVWIGRSLRPAGLFMLGFRSMIGRLRGARDLEVFAGKEFEIQLRQNRVRVALDGETTILESPLHYRSRPQSLRVLVPRSLE